MTKFDIRKLLLPSYESGYKINPKMRDIYVNCELKKPPIIPPVIPVDPEPEPGLNCPDASPMELFRYDNVNYYDFDMLYTSYNTRPYPEEHPITELESIVIPSHYGDIPINIVDVSVKRGMGRSNISLKRLKFCNGPKYISRPGEPQNGFSNGIIEELILPNTLIEIPANCFELNKLTSVDIPDTVINIGVNAFTSNRLTNIHIKNNWIIAHNSFERNLITDITFDTNVSEVRGFSFNRIEHLTLPSTMRYVTGFEGNRLKTLLLNNGLIEIDDNAFGNIFSYKNNQITELVIPDTVKTIGNNAFYNNSISDIQIPNSVISLGSASFRGNNATSLQIGTGLTSIPKQCFYGNKLTNVNIPDTIQSIGELAFYGSSIKNLKISESISVIEELCFAQNNISHIYIPDNVVTIKKDAFMSNPISTIRIGDNVQSIALEALYNTPFNNPTVYMNMLPGDTYDGTELIARGARIYTKSIRPLSEYIG